MKIIFLFLIFSATVFANENFIKFASINYENDYFFNTDHYYTNGIELTFLTKKTAPTTNFSFGLGQKIYTGYDTQTVEKVPFDRPYAGYLYAFLQKNVKQNKINDSFGITVGATGKMSLGEFAQNGTHKLIGSDQAKGWGQQLSNEFLVMATWERSWFLHKMQENAFDWDIITKIATNLGTPFF